MLSDTSTGPDLGRRRILQIGLLSAAVAVAPFSVAEAARKKTTGTESRFLAFRNLHTDEKLRVTFFKDGAYDKAAMQKIYRIMRDHRTGTSRAMDTRLIDLLHDLQQRLKTDNEIEIISGYRSPQTNARLARHRDGVARKSFHMQGKAIDIKIPGLSLNKVYNAVHNMRRGGTSLYDGSGFVHVDTGPVRTW